MVKLCLFPSMPLRYSTLLSVILTLLIANSGSKCQSSQKQKRDQSDFDILREHSDKANTYVCKLKEKYIKRKAQMIL